MDYEDLLGEFKILIERVDSLESDVRIIKAAIEELKFDDNITAGDIEKLQEVFDAKLKGL